MDMALLEVAKGEYSMDIGFVGILATAIVFAILGLVIAYRRKRPAGIGSFVLVAVVAVVGSYLGVGTRLLDVFGFLVPLNWAIVGFCAGWIMGSVFGNLRLSRPEKV